MTKANFPTEFDYAEDSPGFLLWQLSNKWQSRQRMALKAYDLTHVQFVLLAALSYVDEKDNLTQKQLAEYAQTDIMMTSQVLRKLEKKGLIRRESSESDSRAYVLRLTPQGTLLVKQAVKEVENVDAIFFEAVGEDLAKLVTIMQQLVRSLKVM